MFVALHTANGSRVTSIASDWDDRLRALRELAANGQLVCPGCKQLLWLRISRKRRRHFAHRHLADCPLARQKGVPGSDADTYGVEDVSEWHRILSLKSEV